MLDILNQISSFMDDVFIVCFIAIFYISMRNCFWKGDKKKISLFVLSLLTCPITLLSVILYTIFLLPVFLNMDFISNAGSLNRILGMLLLTIVYLLLIRFASGKMAKWLGVKSKQLVRFVYLMFAVFLELEVAADENEALFDNPLIHPIMNISINIIVIIGMLLLYFLVIKELTVVADSSYSTNWKVFVIPPVIFILLFNTSVMYLFWTDSLGGQTSIAVFLFSSIIVFLFIWAFYVIIKNISATSEALQAKDKVKTLSVEVMEALANTIDAKDKYTNGHSIRVAKYSRMIADKMGLPEENCENIYYMGLLHDIGKIGVPNEIINKPSRLDDEEYDIIKTHPEIGYNILSKTKSRPDLSKGARWHHERFDGNGYPDKMTGDNIPIESRIIAVADAYDAMTSNRSYRQYLPQAKVRDEIEKCSGTQFDLEIAKYMLMIIDEDSDYILHE